MYRVRDNTVTGMKCSLHECGCEKKPIFGAREAV